jgi:hypothetical protein
MMRVVPEATTPAKASPKDDTGGASRLTYRV